MHSRTFSTLVLALTHACLTAAAHAQVAAVGDPSQIHLTFPWEPPIYVDLAGGLARASAFYGDTLEIPEAAVYTINDSEGIPIQHIHFRFAFGVGFWYDFSLLNISGMRIRDMEGRTPSDLNGLPLEFGAFWPEATSGELADNYWWNVPLSSLPEENFQIEFLDINRTVVSRLAVTPPSICDSCKTGICSSDPALESVHFKIPVGLTDPNTSLEPQMTHLEFYQEDIPIVGAESIRLLAPQSSSVIPTYGSGGELQSLRVGDWLTTVQEVAGQNPGDPPGLDITVSSDWQNPSATIIRTVAIRNKVDDNQETYLTLNSSHGRSRATIRPSSVRYQLDRPRRPARRRF